jgi:hypothetical protein
MKKKKLLTASTILTVVLNVKGIYEYFLLLGDNGYKFDYENIIKNNKELKECLFNNKKSKLLIAKNALQSLLPGFNIYMSRKGKNLDKITKEENIIRMSSNEIKYYQQMENNADKIIFIVVTSINKNINPNDVFNFIVKSRENIKEKSLNIQNKLNNQKSLTLRKKFKEK